MNTSRYIPRLSYGDRVVFFGTAQDARSGCPGTVIGVLPNPSKRPEHQWYDVRFDDFPIGRFLQKDLRPLPAAQKSGAA